MMDMNAEILIQILAQKNIKVVFENLDSNISDNLIADKCVEIVSSIKQVLRSDLNDFDCVESILIILEDAGISVSPRHDF